MKFLLIVGLVALAHAAYDDLPKVADPYEAPGYEPEPPKDCPDKYAKIIKDLRTDLGTQVSSIKFTNALGSRVQKAFGAAHEIMMAPSGNIQQKTNFNGTICRKAADDGFHYIVYPTPGDYDLSNPALEEYFEKFAEFAGNPNANIADLPKDPRQV